MRALLVGRPQDLDPPVWNGFRPRVLMIRRVLAGLGEVDLVGLRRATDPPEDPTLTPGGRERYSEIQLPPPASTGRANRLAQALLPKRQPELEGWETELQALGQRVQPDLVVTLGPWLGSEFRVLNKGWPVINFFEEDLRLMPELAPQSTQARMLRHLEDRAERSRGQQADKVVFISEREEALSRWRFPAGSTSVLPFTREPSDWQIADSPSTGAFVLAVGNFAEGRNAEGLADLFRRLRDSGAVDPRSFRVVSASGLHPELDELLPPGSALPPLGDSGVWDLYRSSAVAVVPATRATGFKTTILQAWAAGCPVVCSEAAAATMSERHRHALAIATDAEELASLVVELSRSDERRRQLAGDGLQIARTEFDPLTVEDQLLQLVNATLNAGC